MYLGSRPKRRRSSPWRVLILLALNCAAVYVLIQVRQQGVETPFIATPTPTRAASSYVSEAEELYWEGDLAKAIAAYGHAIGMDPNEVEPYIALARLLALKGRMIESVQRAEQAVERAPENAHAWAVLGMTYDWHGEVDRAIEVCQRAIELEPGCAVAHAYLAEAYVDDGQWAKAMESIQTALDLDDRSVDVHRNYGYVMEVQGNYSEALSGYKRALEIHPNLAYIHMAVGKNYWQLGDFDAAMQSFQKASAVDPNSAEAHYTLGRAYYEAGEHEEAKEYLEQATEVDPQFGPAFAYLAFTYWSRRNYEDAIPNLQRAIMLDSKAARQRVRAFTITVEKRQGEVVRPSSDLVMSGDFVPASLEELDMLEASLEPVATDGRWQGARGSVTFDTRTGVYTVTLKAVPATRPDQAYVGWLDGVKTLSGAPIGTGQLNLDGGSLEARFEATWVYGPRIDYFYTLGLAYFYMDECEKAYLLFNAALQIDPDDENASQGIRLCQEAEADQ
ncbi:MAG: tetratricopeptide repeat protein [Anaerolineae bacterium]|jgi:tetratricopeptide (TPR) repeat protein